MLALLFPALRNNVNVPIIIEKMEFTFLFMAFFNFKGDSTTIHTTPPQCSIKSHNSINLYISFSPFSCPAVMPAPLLCQHHDFQDGRWVWWRKLVLISLISSNQIVKIKVLGYRLRLNDWEFST
jgi:hypothetical protein